MKVTYKLREFGNIHQHTMENVSQEEIKRKKQQRNEQILEYYESLLKDNISQNAIKHQLKKKFMIDDI